MKCILAFFCGHKTKVLSDANQAYLCKRINDIKSKQQNFTSSLQIEPDICSIVRIFTHPESQQQPLRRLKDSVEWKR